MEKGKNKQPPSGADKVHNQAKQVGPTLLPFRRVLRTATSRGRLHSESDSTPAADRQHNKRKKADDTEHLRPDRPKVLGVGSFPFYVLLPCVWPS